MNKSKFLTLATTAAVIATTAGTFAAWDQVTDTKTVSLTTDSAHTVKLQSTDLTFTEKLSDSITSIQTDFNVNTANATALTLAATDIRLDNNPVNETQVKVEILDAQGAAITNPITPTDGEQTYKVKVSLTDPDLATKATDYASKPITFTITADITK